MHNAESSIGKTTPSQASQYLQAHGDNHIDSIITCVELALLRSLEQASQLTVKHCTVAHIECPQT